ncbi:hypothetical protein ACN47E_006839 [Coniothyrium glycines]
MGCISSKAVDTNDHESPLASATKMGYTPARAGSGGAAQPVGGIRHGRHRTSGGYRAGFGGGHCGGGGGGGC